MTSDLFIPIIVAVLGSSVLGKVLDRFFTQYDKSHRYVSKEDIVPLHRAMVLLLGEKLERWMVEYIALEHITPEEFKRLTRWFEVYEANGGNDNVHTLYEKCKTLI